MFHLFKTKPLLNVGDAQWVVDTFAWALTYFDNHEFFQRTQLIEPTDKFFPGKINSPQTMANTVFKATLKYTGLVHWPIQLTHSAELNTQPTPLLSIDFSDGLKRNSSLQSLTPLQTKSPLLVNYNLNQTLKPADLSASFAHYIAQHMIAQSQLTPIGGNQHFEQAAEIIAVFMGFGILMTNSAYTFRGGCGRCYNPAANRQAALSEDKMVFALALFCHLKGIKTQLVTKHLKTYLRSYFKRALKQIEGNNALLAPLFKTK